MNFIKYFLREYGLIMLPILISIAGVAYSNHHSRNAERTAEKANQKAQEANDLAKEAISKSEEQFVELNRPQLSAEPFLYQNSNAYYELKQIDEGNLRATIHIVVQNKGNVVASNATIEEATFQISYGASRLTCVRNYYDMLGKVYTSKNDVPQSNFTLMDIQPGSGFVKKLDFIVSLKDTDYTADQIIKLQPDLAVEVKLRLVCTYDVIKGQQFITQTSHAITKDGVSIFENRMGAYGIE